MSEELRPDTRIVVCSACLRACCIAGEFMCDYAEGAGIEVRTVAQLRKGKHGESEHYWKRGVVR